MTHTILDFRFGSLDGGVLDLLTGPNMEMMPVPIQMMQTRLSQPGAASSLALSYPSATPQSDQDPLKHLLIGSPRAIRHTIHQLHILGYAEAGF
jgi:hypothetical protein